jgi:PAS domain S-box-containing protein
VTGPPDPDGGDTVTAERAAMVARETEGRYQALVEGLPDGVTVHIEGKLVFANESIARILGLKASADLIGRDVLDFLPKEVRERAGAALAEIEQGKSVPPREYLLCRVDGGRVFVELRGRRVTFGDRPAVQSVIRDITERKRAERSQAAIR